MSDYPYIRAWGDLLRSTERYVEQEIERARKDGAPQTLIFLKEARDDSGVLAPVEWITFEDILDERNKARVAELVKRYLPPEPEIRETENGVTK